LPSYNNESFQSRVFGVQSYELEGHDDLKQSNTAKHSPPRYSSLKKNATMKKIIKQIDVNNTSLPNLHKKHDSEVYVHNASGANGKS
jgi:hypothetical protein